MSSNRYLTKCRVASHAGGESKLSSTPECAHFKAENRMGVSLGWIGEPISDIITTHLLTSNTVTSGKKQLEIYHD